MFVKQKQTFMKFETAEKVKEYIESYNNAVYKSCWYNEIDGQSYCSFRATKFAAEGISRGLTEPAVNVFDNTYHICIS